jgi:hypothetical protein
LCCEAEYRIWADPTVRLIHCGAYDYEVDPTEVFGPAAGPEEKAA